MTEAGAWNAYAVGAHLMGDPATASWAGLKSIELAWRPLYVCNCGAFLLNLGKLEASHRLLDAAYEMGHGSPYLFEALAGVDQRLGNRGEAQANIQKAKQRAPSDSMIAVESSVLSTGQPPKPRAIALAKGLTTRGLRCF